MSFFAQYPVSGGGSGGGVSTYVNLAAFPAAATAGNGALAIALDSNILYESNGTVWQPIASPTTALTLSNVGTSPNAAAATLSSNALTLQPASASFPGVVSTTTQSFQGVKSFVTGVLIPDGTNAAPGLALVTDTTSGLYKPGVGHLGFAVGGAQAIDLGPSSGGYGNVGFGGAASTSDSFPLLIQRTVAGQLVTQTSNPSTAAGSSTKDQLAVDNGNNLLELAVFTAATVAPDAYAGGRGVVRPSGSTAGLSLIAGDLGTGDIKAYVAGDYSSTGLSLWLKSDKTAVFSGNVSAANLSGTNTGDVTISTANGLSISGQALSLALASTSTTGALSSTDWNTFNGKQAAGNYITALTGDVTAAGPGSVAATLASTISGAKTFSTSLTSPHFISSSLNPAAAGVMQLANSDVLGWRNAANNADITLTVDSSGFFAVNAPLTGSTDNAQALGQQSRRWSNVYATFVRMAGSTSSNVSLTAPSGASYGLTFPSAIAASSSAIVSDTSGTLTFVSQTSAATASTIVARDANINTRVNNLIENYTSVATAAGTTTLTVSSSYQYTFTGTSTQTVVMPVTSTLVVGMGWIINNTSTGVVTVQSSGGNTIIALASNTSAFITCTAVTGTTAASWNATLIGAGGANYPTVQKFTSSSGTYTTPANALFIRVRMVGGGGGGAGGGTAAGTAAGSGGNTTFGTTLLVANGGGPGAYNTNGGSGGSASLGTGPIGTALTGGMGSPSNTVDSIGYAMGGQGGSSAFGGGGSGGAAISGGQAAPSNTGAGGGGGGTAQYSSTQMASGSGGAAGAFVDAIITNPSATYSYSVGAAGTAGGAGTSGQAGGAGGSGYIEVTEFYANGAVGTATQITGSLVNANLTMPTKQIFTSGSGTYTTPTSPRTPIYIKVTCIGGGGGAAGGGASTQPSGNNGNATTFSGTGVAMSAGGGTGSVTGQAGGAGGTATGGDLNFTGGMGAASGAIGGVATGQGGMGGSSVFGGGGSNGFGGSQNGYAAAANTGGGGGGVCGNNANNASGGGGAGAACIKWITNPAASYTFAVAASVSGGVGTGTAACTGGSGGSGLIIVEEFYQ